MSQAEAKDNNFLIMMALYGHKCTLSVGKGVIRALGKPSHISIKISDAHDSLSVFPCDEDDVMSFRVPEHIFESKSKAMRIHSKRFVHGIMQENGMDITRTYRLDGEYIAEKNTAVFSLVNNVTLRDLKTPDNHEEPNDE